MDKYIGNKKTIVDGIYRFMLDNNITSGLFVDAFSGTTNVSQFFKQQGFSVICNDINEFSYILGKVYIENNTFPKFTKLLKELYKHDFSPKHDEILAMKHYIKGKIESDKLFPYDYYRSIGYDERIEPLLIVIHYLNQLQLSNLSSEELVFFNYYTVEGANSTYISSRGTSGSRNYFSSNNAKKIGKILSTIKHWKSANLISEMEFNILLACLIEEVTLNANVNGTFHDFNRHKLYPNAVSELKLKPIMLNIQPAKGRVFKVYKTDANQLKYDPGFLAILQKFDSSTLYIDPPYNFRQYSAYYHMLNFIAKFHNIENIIEYAEGFEYVRGQNMTDNFNSDYCYKEHFTSALSDLINGIETDNVIISYYDENNHWNHGKKVLSLEGRTAIISILNSIDRFNNVLQTPYIIPRLNYQSRSGEHKKQVAELLFFARR